METLGELPNHQATALYLALRPGVTYKDVAAQLRQDPQTILRWLSAGLRELSSTATRERSGLRT